MKKVLKNISRVLFSLLLIVSIFGTFNVLAEEVIFKITNISVKDKSDKVTVNDVSISNGSINNDIVFTDKNDYITYNISFKNSTSDKYKILSITDDNDSDYLDYTYDDLSNVKLDAGEEKTFNLTITYKQETSDLTITDKAVSLTLTYEKDDGTIGTETITNGDNNATVGKDKVTTKNITNPKTGDNVTTYIILGIISLLGLTITTISKKHLSKSLMAIALVSSIALPLGVKADSDKLSIVFNNTIKVREYTVTFNTNGGTEISSIKVVKGNKIEKPTHSQKDNYIFDNWYTDDTYTTKFDFDTPITSDTTIYAHFEELKVCADNENITRLSSTTCSNNENITIGDGIVCKRAVKLHEETCSQTSNYCYSAGYKTSGSKGTSTITYGSCGTSGTLSSGDAFTCDVNGDEKFDELTERFYYVSDYYDTSAKTFDPSTAVLIYYNNVTSGVSCNRNTFAYSTQADIQTVDPSRTSYDNWHGPLTVMKQLPTTSQWSNVSLKSEKRAILGEYQSTHDSPTTSGGTLPTDFTYEGYAARLLTAKELMAGCNLTEVGRYTTGELDSCNYIMENTKYAKSSIGSYGPWLESPHASNSSGVWNVIGSVRYVRSNGASITGSSGARPAIEVLKSKISY